MMDTFSGEINIGDIKLSDRCVASAWYIQKWKLVWFSILLWRMDLEILIWSRVVPKNSALNPFIVSHSIDVYYGDKQSWDFSGLCTDL